MSLELRIVLIVASVLAVIYALAKIRKAELKIDDAFYWVFSSVLLLVMSIFPTVTYFLSELLGIQSPSNFVFLFMIFMILVKLFAISIDLSIQKRRLNSLIQKIAIVNHSFDSQKNCENKKEN